MAHRSRASLGPSGKALTGLVYWRQPNDPMRDTPAYMVDALKGYGGTNLYGEPLWRVILAENHLVQRAGIWHEFDPNDNQVDFGPMSRRDGSVNYQTKQLRPLSVSSAEMRWIPKYPCEGWILERWFPASCWGSKQAWEAVKSSDGVTPMMGPYPARGDYWMMKGPWVEIPTISAVRQGVSSWENSVKHMHGQVDQALFELNMKQFMKVLDEKKAARNMALTAKIGKMRKEMLRAVNHNPRLQAFRTELIEKGRAQLPKGF
jgi:hypothetical protein